MTFTRVINMFSSDVPKENNVDHILIKSFFAACCLEYIPVLIRVPIISLIISQSSVSQRVIKRVWKKSLPIMGQLKGIFHELFIEE